jgi:hypothetical protein
MQTKPFGIFERDINSSSDGLDVACVQNQASHRFANKSKWDEVRVRKFLRLIDANNLLANHQLGWFESFVSITSLEKDTIL